MPIRAGLILCGGASRRMGRPKAWLEIGPERLLQRVVRLVGAATDLVVVVAAPDQEIPELPAAVQVVRDAVRDQGPLRGITTGLAALPTSVELVYASATDVPFLHPGWIDRLAGLIDDHAVVVPQIAGRTHPLAALYRREPTLEAAEALLLAGERRLGLLVDRLGGRVVAESDLEDLDPTFASVRNLNSPEDYRCAGGDPRLNPQGDNSG